MMSNYKHTELQSPFLPILQINKLKKQEEDPWISGEELCTDGSSDEEDIITITIQSKKFRESRPKFIKNLGNRMMKPVSPLAREKFEKRNHHISNDLLNPIENIASTSNSVNDSNSDKIRVNLNISTQFPENIDSIQNVPKLSENTHFLGADNHFNLSNRQIGISTIENLNHGTCIKNNEEKPYSVRRNLTDQGGGVTVLNESTKTGKNNTEINNYMMQSNNDDWMHKYHTNVKIVPVNNTISVEKNVADLLDAMNCNSTSKSNDNDCLENFIQWRPKRGSIKIPLITE